MRQGRQLLDRLLWGTRSPPCAQAIRCVHVSQDRRPGSACPHRMVTGSRRDGAWPQNTQRASPSEQPGCRSSRFGREAALCMRCQTTAAPPERVSDSLTNEGGVGMPKGYGLSEATKDRIWELRAQGLSDAEIGRLLGFTSSDGEPLPGGGRRHPPKAAAPGGELPEPGRARGDLARDRLWRNSARAIARTLRRSHTTVAREINRCGGRLRYRAHAAERQARRLTRRPRPTKSSFTRSCGASSQSICEPTTPPSRSRAGSRSNTRTMRRCGSRTRRSTAPSTSRRGGC